MTEHRAEPPAERPDRSAARAAAAHARISAWLDGAQARGLVLTGPAAVAWATGGIAPPVDRTAAVDLAWVVATPAGLSLVTTEVEADRVRAEYGPERHGFGALVAVPWYDPDAFVAAAQEVAGVPAGELAADGHPAFGRDVTDDLIALRLALSPAEQTTCGTWPRTRPGRWRRRWRTGGPASGTWTSRLGARPCWRGAGPTLRC